jgi:hypothetical protein
MARDHAAQTNRSARRDEGLALAVGHAVVAIL